MSFEIRSGSTDISMWCEECSAKDGRAVATWDVAEHYINLCAACLTKAAMAIEKALVKGEPK